MQDIASFPLACQILLKSLIGLFIALSLLGSRGRCAGTCGYSHRDPTRMLDQFSPRLVFVTDSGKDVEVSHNGRSNWNCHAIIHHIISCLPTKGNVDEDASNLCVRDCSLFGPDLISEFPCEVGQSAQILSSFHDSTSDSTSESCCREARTKDAWLQERQEAESHRLKVHECLKKREQRVTDLTHGMTITASKR